MVQEPQTTALMGGLDLITPPLYLEPGFAVAALNYEPEQRGYRRMSGYERYDGRGEPHRALYWILPFTGGVHSVANDVWLRSPSGGYARTIEQVVETGSFEAGDAAGFFALDQLTGDFVDGEAVNRQDGTFRAVAAGPAVAEAAETSDDHQRWRRQAIEARRTLIGPVPGSGPVRGVAVYRGRVIAWRDSEDGSEGRMWREGERGWERLTFGFHLEYNNGTSPDAAFIAEGETVTGQTSGATAIVRRVAKKRGSYGNGDARGYFTVDGVSGTFQDGEVLAGPNEHTAKSINGQRAISLQPGGTYRTIERNFYAQDGTSRLYFVNGRNHAMEWDGQTLAEVQTLMFGVWPTFIAEHALHLFLGYASGSVQFSGLGDPLSFEPVNGAGEIGIGDELTGLGTTTGALIILGRNKIDYLTGTSSADFQVQPISETSGGMPDTLQMMEAPFFMDDLGVRRLNAAETFGDWRMGTVTGRVEPLLRRKRNARERVVPLASCRMRSKDQYRIWFSDGTGLVIYVGRKNPEVMPFRFDVQPTCVSVGEDADGAEMVLMGGPDGMVYRLDVGMSADGAPIEAFVKLAYHHGGNPRREKRFHRAYIDMDATDAMSVAISSDFGFGDPNQPVAGEQRFRVAEVGGVWDVDLWNAFVWSAPAKGQLIAELEGIGVNVSLAFITEQDMNEPHTLTSMTVYYSWRRAHR